MSDAPARPEDADPDIVRRMAHGDRSALALLYERHAPRLLSLAVGVLRDRREAEDVLHDVFLEAWQRAASYDQARGTVAAWLSLRTRSRAIDRRRAPGLNRSVPLEESALSPSADPSAEPARTLDHGALLRALSAMSPDEQEVIVLGYFDGLSGSEIADALKIPIGTVKSRTRSAFGKLRRALGERS